MEVPALFLSLCIVAFGFVWGFFKVSSKASLLKTHSVCLLSCLSVHPQVGTAM